MLNENVGRFKELSNLGACAESSNISEELMGTARPKEQNKRHQWFKVQNKCEKGNGELEAAANQKQGTILDEQTISATYGRMPNALFLACPTLLDKTGWRKTGANIDDKPSST